MRSKVAKLIVFALGLSLIFAVFSFAAEEKTFNFKGHELEEFTIENFDQAPKLKELVQAGELPPLTERLPKDPYVVEPIEEIGDYGGVARVATTRADWWGEDNMMMSINTFLRYKPETGKYIPHLAKEVTVSEDRSRWTIHLRKGIKWSDGKLFTADDLMFWYNDVLLNEDLTPVVGKAWKTEGEVMEMEKLDEYSVRIKFAGPQPYFINRLAHSSHQMLTPKHYLKQFHPNYANEEELKEKVEENNFDHWYQLFGHKNSNTYALPFNPELPTLASYRLTKKSSNRHVYERNPYFWMVDSAGNQLPYIEKIETDILSDVEVLNGKIMSGEVDFAAYFADIRNYPMFKKFEEKGGYKTLLWQSGMGSEVVYMVNQTHQDPVLRKIFQDTKFRRALSYAIDRQEISDSIYFGKAQPRQYTVLESSQYFKPEFAKSYTEYDPEKAKQLLDEMGLEDTDGDGWRERPDGEKLTFTIEFVSIEVPRAPNVELVTQHWSEIGIDVNAKQISGELQGQRAPANLMDATIWHGDQATDVLFPIYVNFLVPTNPSWGKTIWPEWARWLNTNGDSGEEPPAEIKELHGWWEKLLKEPDEQKRSELAQKILGMQAENLWAIGTVGNAPVPAIADKDLRNVPKDVIYCWSTYWSCSHNPEQMFFEGGVNEE